MKLHSTFVKIVIFCAVLAAFAIPPLFMQKDLSLVFSEWAFPFSQSILFLLSIFLIFTHKDLLNTTQNQKTLSGFVNKTQPKIRFFYKILFPATFVFCALFAVSFLLTGISYLVRINNTKPVIKLPESFTTWIFCILTFLFSAFFEETLYRFYIPDFLLSLNKRDSKALKIAIEITACLLFATAHLYAGVFSGLNALFAHIILRICRQKTGNITAGFSAHFLYNVISLFLSQF